MELRTSTLFVTFQLWHLIVSTKTCVQKYLTFTVLSCNKRKRDIETVDHCWFNHSLCLCCGLLDYGYQSLNIVNLFVDQNLHPFQWSPNQSYNLNEWFVNNLCISVTIKCMYLIHKLLQNVLSGFGVILFSWQQTWVTKWKAHS